MAEKTEKKDPPIITLTCKECGTVVSGPDKDSVHEVMGRHSKACK